MFCISNKTYIDDKALDIGSLMCLVAPLCFFCHQRSAQNKYVKRFGVVFHCTLEALF